MTTTIEIHRKRLATLSIAEHKKRLKLLRKELAGYKSQLKAMLTLPNQDETQLASLQERIVITERDITTLTNQLVELQGSILSAADIRHACHKFDPLWDTLTNKEQWRMLNLVQKGRADSNFPGKLAQRKGRSRTLPLFPKLTQPLTKFSISRHKLLPKIMLCLVRAAR